MKLKTTHPPALNNAEERKDVSQRVEKDQRKDVKEKDELKMAVKMANKTKMTKEISNCKQHSISQKKLCIFQIQAFVLS